MTLNALDVLYVVLAIFLVVVGALLCVVLWQVSLVIAQVRTVHLREVQALLREAHDSLTNVDSITHDVNEKLGRLDAAVDSANSAVQAIGETTVLVNRTIAQPAVMRLAVLAAGVRGAFGFLAERRTRQKGVEPSLEAAQAPRPPVMVRE